MRNNHMNRGRLNRRQFIKLFNAGLATAMAGGRLALPEAKAEAPGVSPVCLHVVLDGGSCPLTYAVPNVNNIIDQIAEMRRATFRPFIPELVSSNDGLLVFSHLVPKLREKYNQGLVRFVHGVGMNIDATGSHERALECLYTGNPSALRYGQFPGVLGRAAALAGKTGLMDVWGVGSFGDSLNDPGILPIRMAAIDGSFHPFVYSEQALRVTGGQAIIASRNIDPDNKTQQDLIDSWIGFELIQEKKAELAALTLPRPFNLNNTPGRLFDAATRLIVGDSVRAKVVNVGYGNFDSHGRQNYALSYMLPQLDAAIGTAMDNFMLAGIDVVVVVTSEFGRNPWENGGVKSRTLTREEAMQHDCGTDHGGTALAMVLATPNLLNPLPSGGINGNPLTLADLMRENTWQATIGWPEFYASTVGRTLRVKPEDLFPWHAETITDLGILRPV